MTAPATVLIDGEPLQYVEAVDRGLHYGDGLFETVIVRRGRARFASLHAARLARGIERLGLPAFRPDFQPLADRLGDEGTLKLILTRGDAVARGYAATGSETARSIVLWYPGAEATVSGTCRATALLTTTWGDSPALAGLKHLNRLEQVLARTELSRLAGFDEALVRSVRGAVISGTQSNVFLVRGDALITPPVDRCGIAGVLREVVLREAARSGLTTRIENFDLTALGADDGLFVTNVRVGVWPVATLDGRALHVTTAVRHLRERIAGLDE